MGKTKCRNSEFAAKNTGTAEGEEVAAWLNSIGVTGIILKYRVPRRADEPRKDEPARRPLQDAQRAVSLVRSKAREWGIEPQRIGIIGFSAGGHLAIATATNFDKRTYEPIDDVDRISCRPDFAVVVYAGYLLPEDEDTNVLAPYIRIPAETPPIFLVHASDDPESGPEHSVALYLALKKSCRTVGAARLCSRRPRLWCAQEQTTLFHLDGALCRLAAKPRVLSPTADQ